MNGVSLKPGTPRIILWILLLVVIRLAEGIGLVTVPECQTQHLLLYNNSTRQLTALQTTNFTVLFLAPFSSQPQVTTGIAGYTSKDYFINELWSIQQTLMNNYTGIIIHMRVETSTQIWKLYINYFAVDQSLIAPGLFQFYRQEYQQIQLVNTSTGTGTRTDTIIYTPSPLANYTLTSFVYCFTKALYMRSSSSSTYEFTVSCHLNLQSLGGVNFTNSIVFTISTWNNVRFEKLVFGFMVINPDIISSDNYYQLYTGSDVLQSTLLSLDFASLNVLNGSTRISSIAIRDFQSANFINVYSSSGSATSVMIKFSWEFVNLTNDSVLRILNANGHNSLYYHFLIFGKVNCTFFWSVPQQQCVQLCGLAETHALTDNICRTCSSPCRTCSLKIDNCTSCPSQYYLFNHTCITCQQILANQVQALIQFCQQKKVAQTNPPFWLFSLAIIPILAIALFCYYKFKKVKQIVNAQRLPNFRQYPSIQL